MSLPISGFMPIPLAIMPPFMAYQSLVMGDAFGRAFQFGKRKISAMSNEEFNKLDIVQLYEGIANEYTRIIPTVEKAMASSVTLQVSIVKELIRTIPALAKTLLSEEFTSELFPHSAHGHPFGDLIPHGEDVLGTPTTVIPPPSVPTGTGDTTVGPHGTISPVIVTEQQKLDRLVIDGVGTYINSLTVKIDADQAIREKFNYGDDANDATNRRLKNLGIRKEQLVRYSTLMTAYKNKYGNWYVAKVKIV